MQQKNKLRLRYIIVGVWLVFTSALAGWWYLFGVEQTRRIIELDHGLTPAMTRHLNMLAWEGATLFFCIVLGGGTLAYLMIREDRQRRRLRSFFSTFTHELKTPLASLRLQAESLREDLTGSPHATLIDRLTSDTERLSIQLENSLFLANDGASEMLIERILFAEFARDFALRWPALKIEVQGESIVNADSRALECILTNTAQNALAHGKATALRISFAPEGSGGVRVSLTDNGVGFRGDSRELGRLFSRFYQGSGNGIGLYLIKRLARRMGGEAKFIASDHFEVQLILKGEVV